jgi:hypothetical protein
MTGTTRRARVLLASVAMTGGLAGTLAGTTAGCNALWGASDFSFEPGASGGAGGGHGAAGGAGNGGPAGGGGTTGGGGSNGGGGAGNGGMGAYGGAPSECEMDDECPPGTVCGPGMTCVPGCTASHGCSGGLSCCNEACVDTDTDEAHCGACNDPCAGQDSCIDGGCQSGTVTTVSFSPTDDTYLRSDSADYAPGATDFMAVRADKPQRAMVRFDVSSIPASASVTDATLTVCAEWVPMNTRTYELHRVTSAWAEATATWNTQPTVVATPTAVQSTPAAQVCWDWSVDGDVQAWVDGTANHGWQLRDQVESASGMVSMGLTTKEGVVTTDHPKLTVSYLPP